ncbi:hypothetical protein J6590_053846 [Homalodisca vitripennis]|nr:hypothetical protein J6590_053846 [Homalodisca vitripennis]
MSCVTFLAKDDAALQFTSGIKVYGNKLYAATSRLQNYITNRISENEDNYRVLVGDLQEMTRGTKCQVDYNSNRFNIEYEPDSESV